MRREAKHVELREDYPWTPALAEATSFLVKMLSVLISLALAWIVFSWLVVPAVIESAYRGESLPFLNSIISGQGIHPVEHYLASWEEISWRVPGMLLVLGLIPFPLVVTGPEVQRYLEVRYGNTLALNPLITNTILALSGLAVVFYLYFLHPVGYVYFITEDFWAEYGSFVGWIMASCFLTWMLFKDRGIRKPGFVLLALGTFFLAMEEISWGQRILDLPSPTVFAEYNLQAETNLHNLVVIPKQYMIAGIAIFLWSILLPLLTRKWDRLREWCDKLGIPVVPMHLWPFFLLAIFHFIYHPLLRNDELAELFLAIAIAALSLNLALMTRRGARGQGAPATLATAGMMVTLGILTVFLVQLNTWPELLKYNLNSFAGTLFPYVGMYRQSEMVFDYVNEHPEFLTPETHFRQGVLLVQRGRHTKAKEILELSLEDQKHFQEEFSESPIPYRITGQVLILLGRKDEAKGAFLQAIEMDQARLEQAKEAIGQARVRWSLTRTLIASGDYEAASQQLSRARALAPDRRTQYWIEHWMRENLQ